MQPKLLITDDDPTSFFILSAIAKSVADIECDHAPDGATAVELVKKNSYFLIVLDYLMPGMDGFTCAKKIKDEVNSPPPIMFVTGNANDAEMQRQGYALGAVDYLQKPVTPEAFCSKVQTFYRLFQHNQALVDSLCKEKMKHDARGKLLDYSGEGIIGFNTDLIIDYANVAASTLLTIPAEELVSSSLKDIMARDKNEEQWWQSDFVQNYLDGQNMHADSATFWRPSGEFFPVTFTQTAMFENGKLIGGIIAFQDITERMLIERRLESLASEDQLTRLLNRRSFYEALATEIENGLRNNTTFSLLLIDIDNFKAINDNFGHVCGDALLEQFGKRLQEIMPPDSTIARLGGDEFAMITRQSSKRFLKNLAMQITKTLKLPYFANGREIYSSGSVGIALFPEHSDEVTRLVSAADTAMYLAKQNGKDGFCFFNESAQKELNEKFLIAVNLRKANFNREFHLVFQPKFNLKTMKMAGAEALIRWNSPTLGLVPPGKFIPVAESIGYISDITQWALKKAIHDTKVWNENSRLNIPLRVAINASPLDLKRGTFVKQVLDAIYLDRLNPTWIELEVTESAVMDDPETAIQVLKKLKQHGIRVSIDDFGTGYSSLNYLKVLPVDYLKVDQTFVKDIGIDRSDEKIIKAIIQLAHSLDLKVIAEGIETVEQLRYLQALGCDYGQGFYLSHPVEAEEIPSLFRLTQKQPNS